MKHLFFVEQPYSLPILRPLEKAALDRGDVVRWFFFDMPDPADQQQAKTLTSTAQVMEFNPDSVIAPGTWLPHFFPGLKVQIFHGFGIEKDGHFRMRGHFDLYCTHGPITTDRFQEIRKRHPHFDVVETGWPKMDPWSGRSANMSGPKKPHRVLYAPTFSKSLTSCTKLLDAWKGLARDPRFSISAKFHPLENTQVVEQYQNIGRGFQVIEQDDILPLMANSDIVVSDTSSAIAEAICLGVPVLAFEPKIPAAHFRSFDKPGNLGSELEHITRNYSDALARGQAYARGIHPYIDGKSSQRVLDAIKDQLSQPKQPKSKPANLLRKYKIVKKMKPYA